MNFDEDEHITLLRDTLRRFLDRELPREEARRLDDAATHRPDVFARLCELGITGLTVPEEYGGSGVDILAAVVCIEELGRRGTSLAGPYIHCAFYGSLNVLENGSEEQKRRLLPRLARGELLFAYGLSEPDVGGDLASATVTGRLSDRMAVLEMDEGHGALVARDLDPHRRTAGPVLLAGDPPRQRNRIVAGEPVDGAPERPRVDDTTERLLPADKLECIEHAPLAHRSSRLIVHRFPGLAAPAPPPQPTPGMPRNA